MKNKGIKFEVGLKSLIVNKNKRFLIIRRNLSLYPATFKDKWDIPGGRIDNGKLLEWNLKREIKEETGISRETDLNLLAAQDIFHSHWGKAHTVRLTYISRVTSDKVKLSAEHTEYKWVKLADLAKVRNLDKYLKKLLKDTAIMSFIRQYVGRAKDYVNNRE